MKISVFIDDALYKSALEAAEPDMEPTELFQKALETFVRVQAAKRLGHQGSSYASINDVPRRQGEAEE